MEIKFVYFDIGNVFHTFEHLFEKVAKDFGKKPDDFGDMFDKYSDQITDGKINAKKLWKYCCQELNIKNGENYDFAKAWVSDYKLIPEMHELAKRIAQKYRVGLLSNHYIGAYSETVKQGMIPDLKYDSVVVSSEVHCKKPEPGIYKIAQDRAGVKTGEIFFIDDKKENLFAAIEFGWQTFLFDYKNPDKSCEELRIILL